MRKGFIEAYCGDGKGKTSLAVGQSVRACTAGQSVIVIQFLKGREKGVWTLLEKLDVDIKLFCFEKSERYFEELSEQEKAEQRENIRNGLGYAHKVIVTHECDLLVLDEILGLPENGIATCDEINELLQSKNNDMHIILTGRKWRKDLEKNVDAVTHLTTEQCK